MEGVYIFCSCYGFVVTACRRFLSTTLVKGEEQRGSGDDCGYEGVFAGGVGGGGGGGIVNDHDDSRESRNCNC
jgi:hypothetical protein